MGLVLVLQDSRGEVQRLIDTFKIAAEESVRILGALLPIDIVFLVSNPRNSCNSFIDTIFIECR